MIEPQDWLARLEPLLSALLEGELTDADRAALDDILRHEPEARQFYARYMFVHAALSWKLRGEKVLPVDSPTVAEIAGPTISTPAVEHGEKTVAPRTAGTTPRGWKGMVRDFSEQPLALAVVVLALVSGAVLIWQFSSTGPQPVAQQPVPPDATPEIVIARVTRSVDAVWEMDAWAADGDKLAAGQRLALKSGLAEIAFESGASLILEGPAELILGGENSKAFGKPRNDNACQLKQGKLVAQAPPSAHGFTVVTPSMRVVDLGTEFGVAVSLAKTESSQTEVQVFQGKVAIEQLPAVAENSQSPRAAQTPRILEPGEALTGDGSGPWLTTNAAAGLFVRELPTRPRLASLPNWPKDSPLQPGDIVAVTFKTMRVMKINPVTGEQQLLMQGRPYDSGQNDHGVSWHCVAVAPDGTLVVGIDGLSGKHAGLLRIDPRRQTIKVLASGGLLTMGQISGVAVANDGNIYAVYQAAIHNEPEHILSVDPSSGVVSSIARLDHAFGICMAGQSHDVLLTSANAVAMSVLQGASISPRVAGLPPGRCLSAVVAPAGRIFLAADSLPDLGERKILEVAREAGHQVRTVATLSLPPNGKQRTGIWNLAAEGNGNLIVSPSEEDVNIYRVDPQTGKSVVVTSGKLLEGRTAVAVVPSTGVLTVGAPQN